MFWFFRGSCAIPDLISDMVVLTGGLTTMQGVFRYSLEGYVDTLPPMEVGRYHHGCGGYLRQVDGVQVWLT